MQLSGHFSLEELTASETASRIGIDNNPNDLELRNLRRLAQYLEQVRKLLGKPIHINSGYRSVALNQKVGGQKMSAHLSGLAADLVCPSYGSPLDVCKTIRDSDILFDQIIYEFDSWCHFAVTQEELIGRRQCLTIDRNGTREGF
jgi:zinc D-Ala-D-Ala carboxypeptidase